MDAKHWLSLDEREEDAAAQQPEGADSETTPLTKGAKDAPAKDSKTMDSPASQTKAPPASPADGGDSPRTLSPASSIGPEGGKDIFYQSDEPRSRSNSRGISDKKQVTRPEGRTSVSPMSDMSGQTRKPRALVDMNGDQTAIMVDSPQGARKDRMDYLKKIARRRMSSECHAMEEAEVNPHKPLKKPSKWAPVFSKSKIDHSPHEMFVQLDELAFVDGGKMAWLEKARWVKFEEDLEEAAGRWGKPHVASLSFRSVVDLRKCIKKGAILLDLPHEDPAEIGQSIVEQLIYIDQMEPEDKKPVLQSLMLERRHVGQVQPRKLLRQRTLSQTSGSPVGSGSVRERFQSSFKREHKDSESKKSVEDIRAHKGEHHDHVHIDMDEDMVKNLADGQSIKSASPPTSPTSDTVAAGVAAQRPRPRLVHRASIDESYNLAQETESHKQPNAIMQRIVKNAEATICMVGKVDFLQKPICAFVRLSAGRQLGNLMEVVLPVRFIFLLMGPEDPTMDYYEIGRAISSLMSHPHFRDAAYVAETRQDILDAILDYLDESMVLPSGEWDKKTLLPVLNKMRKIKKKEPTDEHPEEDDGIPSPYVRTKRPFGGMINDMRRRYPKYLSDLRDALNIKCVAAVFFIYFTCLSPAITFGGVWSENTEKWLGVSEMLVGLCACGIIYSLAAGQPVLCVAATGPILVFEEALYQVCKIMDIDFISFRCWVGFWMTAIVMITVAFEGSVIARFFTRFINDIFAILTAVLLILMTLKKIIVIFMKHPLLAYYPPPGHYDNMTCPEYTDQATVTNSSMLNLTIDEIHEDGHHGPYGQPNTALLSVVLCFGTFIISWQLKSFKTSTYFTKKVRQTIGDFAVPVAILIMVMVDFFIKDTYTEKLAVPDGIAPTNATKRGWIINPLGSREKNLQVWAMFLAIVPAFLLYILVFMETLITSKIVNQKDRGMVKGSGYHLDLFLMGLFSTLCGICGFPFVCPATLRSMTHASALTVWSTTHAPGESPHVIEVKEQRVTGVCVHLLLGLSVLLSPLLRQIPMTVLFGVFFYMGVHALHGVQLMDRFYLFFTPVKHYPDTGYCRKVRHMKMHLFTFIEVFFVLLMGIIKFTKAAIGFPCILMLMMPLRFKILPLIFSDKELAHLDCDHEEYVDQDELDEDKFLPPPKSPSSPVEKDVSLSPTSPQKGAAATATEKEPILTATEATEPQNV